MENEWLQQAIQTAYEVSSRATSNRTAASPPTHDSSRQHLLDGLYYSRRFILTYHIVILGFILIQTLVEWSGKVARRTAKSSVLLYSKVNESPQYEYHFVGQYNSPGRYANVQGDESSSSTSSVRTTYDVITRPPQKDVNNSEETPLLPHGRGLENLPRSWVFLYIKAFCMHQPRPIAYINKSLPSNGTSMLVLLFLGLNIFYCLFNINFQREDLFVVADRFGLVFVVNIPLLYTLAAKNQPLGLLTGWSYESLNIFHRRLGELLCLATFLHGVGMTIVWWDLLRPVGFSFWKYIFLPAILLGLGAFASFEILFFTSLGSFRQRFYEVFLALHVFFQIAALTFLFFHHKTAKPYVGIALGIFVIDRFAYRLGTKSVVAQAEAKIMEDGETIKLSAGIPRRPYSIVSQLSGKSIATGWKPTDHVFITILALGRKHFLQSHPFTILSAGPGPGDDEAHLELLIRARAGFSRDLLLYVQQRKILTIRLDGPYGSAHARTILEKSDFVLTVAGGSGISVTWPLIEHLLYNAQPEEVEHTTTRHARRQRLMLIWVVHKASHLSWLDKDLLVAAKLKGLELVTPLATEAVGRPDLREMINERVKMECGKVGVVASGPESMGRLVRNTCAQLVRDGVDVHVTIEKFGW